MRQYRFDAFDLDALTCHDVDVPAPGPGEVRLSVRALSLNYRDLLVVTGGYNPKLKLPAVPLSDGAGIVSAVGDGVTRFGVGDRVMSHFVAAWQDGPYDGAYLDTTLGTPGPGLAAEEVVLAETACVPLPAGYDFAQAATLPIAALTAWSALITEGNLRPEQTVLTLGTGGVSIFALQIAHAMGAKVIITSSSHDKLERAKALGADVTIHYGEKPRWEKEVAALGGAHVVVENGGAGTLSQSLRAVRPGGVVSLLGALTGLKAEIDISPVLMKRVTIAGVLVDSRSAFLDLVTFLEKRRIEPVIDARFPFEELPAALRHLKGGGHFGKIVLERDAS